MNHYHMIIYLGLSCEIQSHEQDIIHIQSRAIIFQTEWVYVCSND